jgi:predicted  nucleic acid-binding Zn-ribbon protein
MSYKETLKARIREIEKRMAEDESQKLELEIELNKLKLSEFEEDMKESQNQKFLKG